MVKAFETLVRDIHVRLQAIFHKKSDHNPGRRAITAATVIPWSWVAVNIAQELSEYTTGLTDKVLLSILELKWEKTFLKRFKGFDKNFTSIQAVYDANLFESFLLEVTVKRWENIEESNNYRITVGDETTIRLMDICMQPKYSQWISNVHDQLFFKDRKIRLICPPKVNKPILNKYRDETFPRSHRIALIPPTEKLVILLDRFDKEFVHREFPDKIRNIKSLKKTYKLWLKIIHVEIAPHVTTNGSLDGTKLLRTDIFLVDMSSDCEPVILPLYDEQASLASIFKRNDYIGLYDPRLQSTRGEGRQETVFEYSDDTVFFLMPEKEAQEAGLAKINLTSMIEDGSEEISFSDTTKKDIAKRDEEGFMDCSKYPTRIYVKDLVHCMLHVTLYGKIVGLANNNPYRKLNGKKMDRYALRIADSTGTMDITLWEDAGRDSRKLRIGQYVLLEELSTSDKHESSNKRVWYVNGSAICGTKMYNISTLNSILTGESFRSITPLWYAKEKKHDHFQIDGIVTGWELHVRSVDHEQFVLSDAYTGQTSSQNGDLNQQEIDFMDYSMGSRITSIAHMDCLLEITQNQIECVFCGCQIEKNDVVHIFRPKPTSTTDNNDDGKRGGWEGWIEWRLDDGTSTCKFHGGEETLLNVTAHHFRLMSHQSQIKLLDSVIGLPILCSLSGTTTSTYRLDQMTLLEPTQQECREMLEVMAKK